MSASINLLRDRRGNKKHLPLYFPTLRAWKVFHVLREVIMAMSSDDAVRLGYDAVSRGLSSPTSGPFKMKERRCSETSGTDYSVTLSRRRRKSSWKDLPSWRRDAASCTSWVAMWRRILHWTVIDGGLWLAERYDTTCSYFRRQKEDQSSHIPQFDVFLPYLTQLSPHSAELSNQRKQQWPTERYCRNICMRDWESPRTPITVSGLKIDILARTLPNKQQVYQLLDRVVRHDLTIV